MDLIDIYRKMRAWEVAREIPRSRASRHGASAKLPGAGEKEKRRTGHSRAGV
ncbi:hypothetical protein [Paenibacillus yonginensis]|uniref:hypothetical protein n=1 Tax=Paenibacillus yonginensis TaxID=1462996 RepID=UPI0014712846|nr:hypothetical protein [Paenibacillus yonginensis]